MALTDQIAADFAATALNVNEFAQAVTYTPTGGSPASINGLVSQDSPFQEPYVRGDNFAGCTITVALSDVATPQHGDTYTFGGYTWEHDPTQEVITYNAYFITVALRRRES